MTRFRDVYAPSEMPGYPCISSPRTSTTITQSSSGAEHANQNWEHPLWHYTLPEAVRTHAAFEAVERDARQNGMYQRAETSPRWPVGCARQLDNLDRLLSRCR